MSDHPPQQQKKFTFVNFTTPAEAKNTDAKKRVRSAAAFSGWDKRFAKRLEESEYGKAEEEKDVEEYGRIPPSLAQWTSSSSDQVLNVESRLDAQHYFPGFSRPGYGLGLNMPEAYPGQLPWMPEHRSTDVGVGAQEDTRERPCPDCARRQCKRHIFAKTDPTANMREMKRSTKRTTTAQQNARAARLLSLLETPPKPSRISAEKLDPFNSYPVPAEPWFDWALHHSTSSSLPQPPFLLNPS